MLTTKWKKPQKGLYRQELNNMYRKNNLSWANSGLITTE